MSPQHTILTTLLLLLAIPVFSQSFTDSNLPIVIINTDGNQDVPDDPRILATMKIIYRGEGQRNYITDQGSPDYLDYDGRINIEVRGSTSQAFDKKQYGLSTKKADNISNNNVSLLGLPEEHDWILNCMIFDPSMMRNYLSFWLSNAIGEYSSRCVYCELVLNGSYRGLYLLEEKVKPGQHRVNINKIGSEDITGSDLTGGYITKADKTTGGDPVAWTMSSYIGVNDVTYIHEIPDPDEVKPEQNNYIRSVFTKLASTASAGNISFDGGFPSVIDVPSFVDFMLLNELASNADAYQFSTYYHKDRNGKLRAGPLWDMDLTYGNDLFIWGADNRSLPDVWQFHNWDNEGPKYWRDLFNNQTFRCYLSRRWNELTQPGMPFSTGYLTDFINQTREHIEEAAEREENLWGTVGNLSFNCSSMISWLGQRITWMTQNLGSYYSCADPETPPLVITKIMYAPDTTVTYPDSKDLEFIEITNTGAEIINLTGVYFRGTGFVFGFPPSAAVGPGESKIVAGNASVFMQKYGFMPDGQFSRSLSNSGEDLVLADGFGNVIDEVSYSDELPWPDAKFNGYYLKLPDPGSDNNIGSNWIASASAITAVDDAEPYAGLKLWPLPVHDILKIESDATILSVGLYDMLGTALRLETVNSGCYDLNMTACPAGMYIVRIITPGGTRVRKVIRD